MAPTQFKYYWGDFSRFEVTDPLSGQSVGFKQFKRMIDTDMTGIMNDLGQGQTENAKAHVQGLARRYETLTELCENCHDTERTYYVGDDVRKMMTALQSAADQVPVDMAKVGGLVQGIGAESCGKCHWAHIPAAYNRS